MTTAAVAGGTNEPADGSDAAVPNVEHLRTWVEQRHGVALSDYRALHRWTVESPDTFWLDLWAYFGLPPVPGGLPSVAAVGRMPDVTWFAGARLNYVDQVMRHRHLSGPAVVFHTEDGAGDELSWPELHRQVAALTHTLSDLGVAAGDVVVGYLPHLPQTIVAFLATASLGAVWSACGQDYAASSAAERLGQLRPKVLVTANGYHYGGKDHDRRQAVRELRSQLPDLVATIVVDRLGIGPHGEHGLLAWVDVVQGRHPLSPVQVPFDHPLWALSSSGTTGKPKQIVHGHGGVLLEHLKQMAFHLDLGPGDRYFWYTSPSWMMWNFQVAGLLVGATVFCYDGSPAHPQPDQLWALADEMDIDVLGTSPAYIAGCRLADVRPADTYAFARLSTVGVTGSVLPPDSYDWVRSHVSPGAKVASTTGGTDVVSAFAGSVPTLADRPGEITAPCLGVAVEAWDDDGRPVVDQVGELVIVEPLPSMPVGFWDDPDRARLRAAYYDTYPGVWRHGDLVTVTDRGSLVVHGRSDSTLNRNGVRMGTADIYSAVEPLAEIAEALVVGVERPDGSYWMPMFVVLADGCRLDAALESRISAAIREHASPRHVPDEVIAVPALPHTRTGKKVEVPIKRILQGADVSSALSTGALDDAAALGFFVTLAEERAPTTGSTDKTTSTPAPRGGTP